MRAQAFIAGKAAKPKASGMCYGRDAMAPASERDGDDAEDAALVAAMAQGDRKALAALYHRHAGVLLGLALRIVRERREAEDLLHDVLLEAWRAAKDFDPKRGRVRTWLAIRMRSRALDLQKSARVSRNAGDAGLAVVVDESERASPDHPRVRAAVAELGPDQKKVVELAYFEGLSCSEIAERISIPIGTVKSRLAAGLKGLRDRIGDGGAR
ncbi:MAG TPA: sigma-70 family RNA polymerase sigma factor [Kofleriaceae bacterium]|nr:sigma-70 family RNA polymerase sigma factor [Kofleriaceae bacterium]